MYIDDKNIQKNFYCKTRQQETKTHHLIYLVISEAMTKNRNQIRQRKKKRWPISTNCDQTTQKKEAKWAKQVCWSREGWWVGSLIMCMLESESHADLIHACECHVQVLWWRMGRDMQWWVCWRKTVLVVWSHWRKEIKIAMRKGLPQLVEKIRQYSPEFRSRVYFHPPIK